jgi:hypothetical protein
VHPGAGNIFVTLKRYAGVDASDVNQIIILAFLLVNHILEYLLVNHILLLKYLLVNHILECLLVKHVCHSRVNYLLVNHILAYLLVNHILPYLLFIHGGPSVKLLL